ncbi:hypothetical protein D9M71_761350 [compost metagenome]
MASGAKLDEGLAWRKPKPVRISRGARARKLTSLICRINLMCCSACCASHPIGTSSTSTTNSPSKSMPWLSLGNAMSSRGPMKSSPAPWYISGVCSTPSMGSRLKAFCIKAPWLRKAEPSHH